MTIRQGHFPDAYGSRQDTRYTDVTQLNPDFAIAADDELKELEQFVTEEQVNLAEADARPQSEMPRWLPIKQIFQFNAITNILTQQNIPFKAQSLRVDNFTNQWVFVPQLRLFIPPDWFGAILSTTGISAFTIDFQAPPGLTQAAPTAGAIVNCVAHSERLIDVAGVKRL